MPGKILSKNPVFCNPFSWMLLAKRGIYHSVDVVPLTSNSIKIYLQQANPRSVRHLNDLADEMMNEIYKNKADQQDEYRTVWFVSLFSNNHPTKMVCGGHGLIKLQELLNDNKKGLQYIKEASPGLSDSLTDKKNTIAVFNLVEDYEAYREYDNERQESNDSCSQSKGSGTPMTAMGSTRFSGPK